MAAMGALPERARLGHGARGLQPGRRGLGLLPPRSRPLAGVPVERGRPRRPVRRAPDACASPSPSGTGATRSSRSASSASPAARATTARTPRSTGGTSTPRRRTRGCAGATCYPQAAFPYEDLVEENARPRQGRAGVRAARHGRLRRRPLLGHRRRLRQGRRRTTCCLRVTRPQRRARRRRRCTSCRRCGSATRWSWGAARDAPVARARTATRSWPTRRRPAADDAVRATAQPEPLVCDNETNAQRLWGAAPARRTPRTASTTTSCRRADGQPGAARGPRRRSGTGCAVGAGGDRRGAAAAGRRPRATSGGAGRRRCPTRAPRGRRVLRRARSGGATPDEARRHAAGLRRDALEQAVLPLRRRPLARRRSRPARRRRPSAAAGATRPGATSTTTT